MELKYIIIIMGVITNVTAQLLLRKGAKELNIDLLSTASFVDMASSIYVWAGLFFYGISFVLYIYILSKFEVSFIYPVIMSAGVILLLIFSVLFLNETITIKKVFGILIICVGIFILFRQ